MNSFHRKAPHNHNLQDAYIFLPVGLLSNYKKNIQFIIVESLQESKARIAGTGALLQGLRSLAFFEIGKSKINDTIAVTRYLLYA